MAGVFAALVDPAPSSPLALRARSRPLHRAVAPSPILWLLTQLYAPKVFHCFPSGRLWLLATRVRGT
eukprot:2653320-Pyramimonas_sp.AAC.1